MRFVNCISGSARGSCVLWPSTRQVQPWHPARRQDWSSLYEPPEVPWPLYSPLPHPWRTGGLSLRRSCWQAGTPACPPRLLRESELPGGQSALENLHPLPLFFSHLSFFFLFLPLLFPFLSISLFPFCILPGFLSPLSPLSVQLKSTPFSASKQLRIEIHSGSRIHHLWLPSFQKVGT